MKKSLKVLALAAVMLASFGGSNNSVSVAGIPAPTTVEMCYYGLTIKIPASYVPRYKSIGATVGACGAVLPPPCLIC